MVYQHRVDHKGINNQDMLGVIECSDDTADECFCNIHADRRSSLLDPGMRSKGELLTRNIRVRASIRIGGISIALERH